MVDVYNDVYVHKAAVGSSSGTVAKFMKAKKYDGPRANMVVEIVEKGLGYHSYEPDKNIVFFCYTPHHMFAVNDLVVLKEPAYDANKWVIVPPSPTPGWLEKSSAGVAWDTASLHVSYSVSLEAAQPKAAAMLAKVSLDTETLTAMTYALAVEKQEPAAFAAKWVEENKATVDSWFQ